MTRYRHFYAAFGREVLNSTMMEVAMRGKAEKVHARFVETAPVQTSEFKDSAHVESGRHGGVHHDRAYGRVVVDDPAAMSIEFGHRTPNGTHVEGSYTLTNALRAVEE